MKHKKYLSNGLPKGYNTTPELYSPENPRLPPPAYIHYCEKYVSPIIEHHPMMIIGSIELTY